MQSGSLLQEARRRNPNASDRALVVGIAAELVEALDLEPPILPEMLASYQGISRVERMPLAWAGCLLSEGDELVIKVRDSDTHRRQRFTILHEVAHTFLPGYRHTPQFRCTPLGSRARRDAIEILCDTAASELLMPARYVRSFVASALFHLEAVEALADECESSFEAAARRFVSMWPEPSMLVRMELTTKPREPHGEPKLRVSSSLANGTWPYLPIHKSVPDGHVLYECLQAQPVDCVTNLDVLAGQAFGPLEVHARCYPYYDNDGGLHERVLVLARKAH